MVKVWYEYKWHTKKRKGQGQVTKGLALQLASNSYIYDYM